MSAYIEGLEYPQEYVRLIVVRKSDRGYSEAIVQTLDRGKKKINNAFPGGRVERGETPIKALMREVSEEGIMGKFERDWAEHLWEYDSYKWRVNWRNKGQIYIDTVYMAEWYPGIYSGMLLPQDPEIKSVRWQNLHEIAVDRRAPRNMQTSAITALESYSLLRSSNIYVSNLPLWPDFCPNTHSMMR